MNAWKISIAFVLGGITVLSFAPFYGAGVPIATLAVWAVLIERVGSIRQAAGLGLAWGLGFFGLGVQWVYTTVYTIGGMPQALGLVMYALFALYLSVYPALVAAGMKWLGQWMRQRGRYLPGVAWGMIFPVLWVASEWLRGEGQLGFNWLTLGYSQADVTPLAGWARWIGVYGVSFWLAALAGTLGMLCLRVGEGKGKCSNPCWNVRPDPFFVWCVALLGITAFGEWSLRHVWTQPGAAVRVSLIQGNVRQESKWDEQAQLDIFRRYTRLLNEATGQLVVVPETALPVFRHQLPPLWVDERQAMLKKQNRTALLGIVEHIPSTGRYYNSIWSYGLHADQGYRKRHLVPFGEFIPGIQWLGFLERLWTMPLASFSRGVLDPAPLNVGEGIWLAPSICYEDGFSYPFRAEQATLLLNISNDAWFGDGVAINQHLQIAQIRSIESAKPMIRSNNTAGTAIIDASGHVVKQLSPFKEGILEGQVITRQGETPFMRYGERGLWIMCIASVLMAWTALWIRGGYED